MISNLIMIFLLFLLTLTVLIGIKPINDSNDILPIEESNIFRGIWAIIIIMVHVPNKYYNFIQDTIGSFAYIGVTFFFMCSSYGLMYGLYNKKDYLSGFWKNRIPKLLIPCASANIISLLFSLLIYKKIDLMLLISINKYVLVLLNLYFLFYIIQKVNIKKKIPADLLIVFLTMIISIVTFGTKFKVAYIWPEEVMGFSYGILLYKYKDNLLKVINKKRIVFNIIAIVLSLFLGVLYIKTKGKNVIADYIIKILLGLVLVFLNILIINCFRFGNMFNKSLGKISFELYLIHIIVFNKMAYLVSFNNSGMYISLCLAITILLSIFCYRFNKKVLKKIEVNK